MIFPPWSIVVDCKALAVICALQGSPDLGSNNYATKADCDRGALQIAMQWMPPRGAYTFNCRRWPW